MAADKLPPNPRNLDMGEVVSAMREAMRRAALLGPAAIKELALDLSEIKFSRAQFAGRGPAGAGRAPLGRRAWL
jgi:hypothetical protein